MTSLKFSRLFLLVALFVCISQDSVLGELREGWYKIFIDEKLTPGSQVDASKNTVLASKNFGEGASNTVNSPSISAQDLGPDNPDLPTVKQALQPVVDFSGIFMNNLKNTFKAITPVGLYSTLSILKSVSDKDSPTETELEKEVNVKPTILKGINDYLKSLSVTSVNLLYVPDSKKNEISKSAMEVFIKAGSSLTNTQEELNRLVSEGTNKLVTKLDISKPDFINFFNVVALKFFWLAKFEREDSLSTFEGKSVKFIHAEEHLGFVENSRYTAVQLDFGTVQGSDESKRIPGVHSYMIQVHNGFLNPEILKNVHSEIQDKIKNSKTEQISFSFPSFKLEEKIEFNKGQYPQLLRDKTTDFHSLGDVKQLLLAQKTVICVDEFGASATGITQVIVVPFSAHGPKTITFNRVFYHVIVEAETGAPLFIGRVTEATDGDCVAS
ncbi:serpin peptidase inhibitor, clade A (alpha-1 antiproteinase, antitrypsin), member 10 [Coelomomyces lativittatus]|nr:serpin peptidase inhibitor, clade A (alpha-1 antiproteinase, antitrypsin), member 10 [Coelomomyces lativittatus]